MNTIDFCLTWLVYQPRKENFVKAKATVKWPKLLQSFISRLNPIDDRNLRERLNFYLLVCTLQHNSVSSKSFFYSNMSCGFHSPCILDCLPSCKLLRVKCNRLKSLIQDLLLYLTLYDIH